MTKKVLTLSAKEIEALSRSSDRYPTFRNAVNELRPVAQRHMDNTSNPTDPLPLGKGLSAVAYPLIHESQNHVVRFLFPDEPEILQLRLRNLARTEAFEIPFLEELTTHSLEEETVVTKMAPGKPTNLLTPAEIMSISDNHITKLMDTASLMADSGLLLDTQWGATGEENEDPFLYVLGHYDPIQGPYFFDIISEHEEPRQSEAGRNYAELLTSLVATHSSVDPTHDVYHELTFEEVESRILFLNRGYSYLRNRWPNSSGIGWLERAARKLVGNLPDSDRASFSQKYAEDRPAILST